MTGLVRLAVLVSAMVTLGVSGASATNKDDKEAELRGEISKVYAKHLFVSTCATKARGGYRVSRMNAEQMQKLNAQLETSCGCIYKQIADDIQPEEITDYVMYRYGATENGKTTPEAMKYMATPKFHEFGTAIDNKRNVKKCGLAK